MKYFYGVKIAAIIIAGFVFLMGCSDSTPIKISKTPLKVKDPSLVIAGPTPSPASTATVTASTPTVTASTPTVTASTPTVTASTPTVTAPAPTVTAPAPTVTAPAPTVTPPPPLRKVVITCTRRGVGNTAGFNSHAFTATDCGGTLPDNSYVGVVSKMQVQGGWAVFGVLQPQQDTPGAYFWALAAGGGYQISAVFIRNIPVTVAGGTAPLFISCRQIGYSNTGANLLSFLPSQCTGNQLPNAMYTGMVSNMNVENGLVDFTTLQPSEAAPGFYFWANLGGLNSAGRPYSYDVSILFVNNAFRSTTNNIPFAVTCLKTGLLANVVSGNAASMSYAASDCGLSNAQFSSLFIDNASSFSGGISKLQVSNGTIDFYAFNPNEPVSTGIPGPGIYFWANAPGGGAGFIASVTYVLNALLAP